jgi:hypothetical protein
METLSQEKDAQAKAVQIHYGVGRGSGGGSCGGFKPPLFYIIGKVDGVSHQLDISHSDAHQWRPIRVVVEVKNRVNRIPQDPPLYDQIQLVAYMIMLGCDCGDLVQSITTPSSAASAASSSTTTSSTKPTTTTIMTTAAATNNNAANVSTVAAATIPSSTVTNTFGAMNNLSSSQPRPSSSSATRNWWQEQRNKERGERRSFTAGAGSDKTSNVLSASTSENGVVSMPSSISGGEKGRVVVENTEDTNNNNDDTGSHLSTNNERIQNVTATPAVASALTPALPLALVPAPSTTTMTTTAPHLLPTTGCSSEQEIKGFVCGKRKHTDDNDDEDGDSDRDNDSNTADVLSSDGHVAGALPAPQSLSQEQKYEKQQSIVQPIVPTNPADTVVAMEGEQGGLYSF